METSGSLCSGKTTRVTDENSDSESEDSSSSSALDSFRRDWKNELKVKKTPTTNQSSYLNDEGKENVNQVKEKTIEEEATEYFLEGVKFEREGQLYDAVKYYRKAIQLVPDIETRLSDFQTPHVKKEKKEKKNSANDKNANDEEEEFLLKKFLQEIELKGWIYFDKSIENGQTHISELPSEVISYILRWVISCDLDMRSLDVLSGTSRGMYCLCRDEELWRMACKKMWNSSVLPLDVYSSYREMFLHKPRLRFDGVYISRVTYVRSGEQSFQDHWYRPWHLVEYFRYLRLFPNGEVYFLTSAEQPKNAVFGLRSYQRPQDSSTLRGRYRFLQNGRVSVHLEREPITNPHKKRRGEIEPNKFGATSYYMELEIVPLKKKFKHNLVWKNYNIKISRQSTRAGINEMTENGFDVNSTHFPPFYFSRVKSYNKVSEKILE